MAELALVGAAAGLWALVHARPGWGAAARALAAGLAGVAIAATPTVVAYVAVHGWTVSGYLRVSAEIGFEWRLLPLRWVTIMLDPMPLFPEGRGMIEVFPWIVPGLAGMAACLVAPPGRGTRLPHAVVVGAACAHVALYLCYRDLHPQGLWRYDNYHYFKWVLPVLALYAILLPVVLLERSWGALAAGGLALAVLLPWRATLALQDGAPLPMQAGSVLRLKLPAFGVGDSLAVAADGSFEAIYQGQHKLRVGETRYGGVGDFKTTPAPGGLLISALRPLRAGPAILQFTPSVALVPGIAPRLARQRAMFGRPCWLPAWLGSPEACAVTGLIPGPVVHPGERVAFEADSLRMLVVGWSLPGPIGRWTEGPVASLSFRLAPPAGGTLVVEAAGLVTSSRHPLHVSVLVGGAWLRPGGTWPTPCCTASACPCRKVRSGRTGRCRSRSTSRTRGGRL